MGFSVIQVVFPEGQVKLTESGYGLEEFHGASGRFTGVLGGITRATMNFKGFSYLLQFDKVHGVLTDVMMVQGP